MNFSSPLGALILVFALTAVLLVFLGGFTLFLSARHRRRLQGRVYQQILDQQRQILNPRRSAAVLSVLTADDLRAAPELREEVRQIIVRDEEPAERGRGEDEPRANGNSQLDRPPPER